MSKEETMEYKAKLDDKILYLLRLKAMQMEIVDRRYTCRTHEKLYDLLMVNQETVDEMEKGTPYFERLMKEIGLRDDSTLDNPKYKVSVLTLKRLYGRISSNSRASKNTLNYIARFISDLQYDWNELQERIKASTKKLERDCLWRGSGAIYKHIMIRPRDGSIDKIYSSRLYKGDKLYIMFDNESTLVLYYVGNNKYRVTYTESRILRVGYSLVFTSLRCLENMHVSEVYDENGNLTDGYQSDRIKAMEFLGNPDVEWQKTLNSLEQSEF